MSRSWQRQRRSQHCRRIRRRSHRRILKSHLMNQRKEWRRIQKKSLQMSQKIQKILHPALHYNCPGTLCPQPRVGVGSLHCS